MVASLIFDIVIGFIRVFLFLVIFSLIEIIEEECFVKICRNIKYKEVNILDIY